MSSDSALPIENDVFSPFQRLIYLEHSISFAINFFYLILIRNIYITRLHKAAWSLTLDRRRK